MQTIQELQAQLANGSTTAEKLAQASLEKIESTKNLNAYISVLDPMANSSMFVLPTMMAPAASSFSSAVAV